jgi:hypothetical protein
MSIMSVRVVNLAVTYRSSSKNHIALSIAVSHLGDAGFEFN